MATEVMPQRIDSDYDMCQHGTKRQVYFLGHTYAIDVQLPISTDIEQTTGSVVRSSDKRVAIREELDGVDVGLMAGEGLDGLASPDIPQFRERVTSSGDEGVLVGGVQADAHHVAEMIGELHDFGARLDIPLHASHVA